MTPSLHWQHYICHHIGRRTVAFVIGLFFHEVIKNQ